MRGRRRAPLRPAAAGMLLAALAASASAANILMATLGGTRSHKIPFLALGHALAGRGHNVTLLSAFPPGVEAATAPAPAAAPVREITPAGLVFFVRNFTDVDLLGARMRGELPFTPADMLRYGYQVCEALLGDPETSALLATGPGGQRPDLLVLDGGYPECALGLAHHWAVPFLYINTVGFYTGSLSLAGSPAPWAVTPFIAAPLSDHMGLWGRALNTGWHLMAQLVHVTTMQLFLQPVLNRHFGPSMPAVYALGRNVSFILQNGHVSVSYPRAYLPNVAEVACLHCQAPRPLPPDLEQWVSGAGEAGFVFVSMGSGVVAAKMPAALRALMAAALGRLPQRVLWKWEGPAPPELPPNVRTATWLPQQDLLGHPRIRAFVSHGGLLSMYEAAYHAVPLLSLPVFCDHDVNAVKAEVDGYALRLELGSLTAERLARTISRLVQDPRFRQRARERSALLRDQPEPPLRRAVYWTEYVLRHRGAPHLQSPARDLSLAQYFLLDVLALYAAAGALAALAARRALRALLPAAPPSAPALAPALAKLKAQ